MLYVLLTFGPHAWIFLSFSVPYLSFQHPTVSHLPFLDVVRGWMGLARWRQFFLSSLCVISKLLVLDFMAWSDNSVERRSQVETGDR
jgi:hypothetical protein